MASSLYKELIEFALSKNGLAKKTKYIFLGTIYFFLLSNIFSKKSNTNSSTSTNASGDDIYPLF